MTWGSWKQWMVMILVVVSTASCATWTRTFFAGDLSIVSLGDDKDVVIEGLGGVYTPVASVTRDGHLFEVLEFVEKPFYMGRANSAFWTRYWVYFMDGKLVKYERATAENLMEHLKWIDNVMAMAATIDAFKGTSLSPIHVEQSIEHSGRIDSDVNVRGTIDVR